MRLGWKILMVAGLTLALMIPIAMIRGTVEDRQRHRDAVVRDVARSTAGAQRLTGPVLVVPWTDRTRVVHAAAEGGRPHVEERVTHGHWVGFPETLEVDGTLRPTPRRRGLHEVRLYELDVVLRAGFRGRVPMPEDAATVRTHGTPRLGLGIDDVRGLVGTATLAVDGTVRPLRQGLGFRRDDGVHATLEPVAVGAPFAYEVQFAATLQGTEALSVVPIAGANAVRLDSPWPHPSFSGEFLPRTREIDARGFRASWDVPALATRAQAQFSGTRREGESATGPSSIDAIGLTLVDPVNAYSKVDRATKYAVLFVLLSFVAFFTFELLRQWRIHPIQYGLVGLAIALFFLLLLSLSEHVAFGVAYVVAAAACLVLIAHYLAHVLGSARRGLGFAALLGTLYAALYGLLVSEDAALLLGAGLLFVVLATVMVVTRKIDWYGAATAPTPAPGRPAA